MFSFRTKKNNDFGRSRGWAKFFHRLIMFILYPFRKPLTFIALLAVLYALPIFLVPVKPLEVHIWYGAKATRIWNKTVSFVKSKTGGFVPSVEYSAQMSDKIVENPRKRAASKRKTFEMAKTSHNTVDILATQESMRNMQEGDVASEEVAASEVVVDEVVKTVQNTLTSQDKVLNINYLSEEYSVSGAARVKNVNELIVDGVQIILYGIYAVPYSSQGFKAEEFLNANVEGKRVVCRILATTKQDIATGICYLGNVSINHLLVEKGWSRDVALPKRM